MKIVSLSHILQCAVILNKLKFRAHGSNLHNNWKFINSRIIGSIQTLKLPVFRWMWWWKNFSLEFAKTWRMRSIRSFRGKKFMCWYLESACRSNLGAKPSSNLGLFLILILQPLMLSSSADCTIKLWRTFIMDDDEIRQTSGHILGTFSYKPSSTNYIDIPTSVGWL